jgi:hypothetical protein
MSIRSSLGNAPGAIDLVFRYAMLVALLGLLAADVYWDLCPSPANDPERYANSAVVFMLLLNHLSFAFKWPHHITVWLRVMACAWMVCVAVYLFCLLLGRL